MSLIRRKATRAGEKKEEIVGGDAFSYGPGAKPPSLEATRCSGQAEPFYIVLSS